MTPFFPPPTGLAVGLARKESRATPQCCGDSPLAGGPACGSPVPRRPGPCGNSAFMSPTKRGTLAKRTAATVRSLAAGPGNRHRPPRAAVRGGRPRGLRRQRRRPAAPGRRQGRPAGHQVGPLPRADRPRAGRRLPRPAGLHAARGAVAGPRRRGGRLPDGRPHGAARAARRHHADGRRARAPRPDRRRPRVPRRRRRLVAARRPGADRGQAVAAAHARAGGASWRARSRPAGSSSTG